MEVVCVCVRARVCAHTHARASGEVSVLGRGNCLCRGLEVTPNVALVGELEHVTGQSVRGSW